MTHTDTSIASIGEFGLIERIRRIIGDPPAGVLAGARDDAAAWKPAPGKLQLLGTDSFAEGVHFDLTFTPLKHLGWKVMTAGISDIAAMGGLPRLATVSLCLPPKFTVPMVEELYEGIASSMKEFSYAVVGGDTVGSAGNAAITVSVAGEVEEAHLRRRSGARPGDLLCVSGHLGAAYAGLRILQREKERFLAAGGRGEFSPVLAPYAAALRKHFVPRPRTDLAALTAGAVAITSMIDVSDGLAPEVRHLCDEGGVGAEVHEHNLPVVSATQAIAAEFGEPPTDYALFGGEEYELLFTLSDAEYGKLESLSGDVSIIGRIVERGRGISYVREDGTRTELPRGGWDHFRSDGGGQ